MAEAGDAEGKAAAVAAIDALARRKRSFRTLCCKVRTASVSICQHLSASVSIFQQLSASVSICQHAPRRGGDRRARAEEALVPHPLLQGLISLQVYLQSISQFPHKNQFPHTSVNVFFKLVIGKNKLTDLWEG